MNRLRPPSPSRPRRSRAGALALVTLGVGAWLGAAAHADAQRRRGGDFPSWQRETDPAQPDPLPLAPRGAFVPEKIVALEGVPTGLAALHGGGIAVSMLDGRVVFLDANGSKVAEVDVGGALDHPPRARGDAVLIAGRATLALVGPEGVRWTRTPPDTPARAPSVLGRGAEGEVLLVSAAGGAALVSAATGETLWAASLGAPATTDPTLVGGALVLGTAEGDVVALDRATGSETWRFRIGERVSSLTADADALYGTSWGPTPRTPRVPGPFAFRIARAQVGRGKPEPDWKLRLGGRCEVAPLFLDENVVFASSDGYLHAVDRERGSEGWRFDVPSTVRHPPVRSAGRLDIALELTHWIVALSADTGGLMGWLELPDEDELFVGPAVSSRGRTWVVTNLGRVIALRFEIESWPQPESDRRPL